MNQFSDATEIVAEKAKRKEWLKVNQLKNERIRSISHCSDYNDVILDLDLCKTQADQASPCAPTNNNHNNNNNNNNKTNCSSINNSNKNNIRSVTSPIKSQPKTSENNNAFLVIIKTFFVIIKFFYHN